MGGGGRGKRKEDQEGWWWVSGWVGRVVESDRKASDLEPSQPFIWAALLVCLPGGGGWSDPQGQRRKQMSLQEGRDIPEDLGFTL